MNRLGDLIARNLNQMEVIRPRLASRFESVYQNNWPSFRASTWLVKEEISEKRRPAREPTSYVQDASLRSRISGASAFRVQDASGQSISRRPERVGIIQESRHSSKPLQPAEDARSPVSKVVDGVVEISERSQAGDDRTGRLLPSFVADPLTVSSIASSAARDPEPGQRRGENSMDQETADEDRAKRRASLETHALSKERDEDICQINMGPGIREEEAKEAESESRLHAREAAPIQSDQEPDHSFLDHGLRIFVEASSRSIETEELESEEIPPQKENSTPHSSQDSSKIRGQKKDIHNQDRSALSKSERPRISPKTVMARPIVKSYLPPEKIEEKTVPLGREPDVLVTIGRIEVRAMPPLNVSPRKQEGAEVISLEDYLKDRRGGL